MATVESDQQKTFSVQEVADIVGKTDGRIRQICREFNIGTLYGGRFRLLNRRDLNRIRQYLDESGKNFTKDD